MLALKVVVVLATMVNTCLAGSTYLDVYGDGGLLTTDPGCTGGTRQSPINIDPTNATIHSPIYYRNYFNGPKYNKFFNGVVKNTGTTIKWYIDDQVAMSDGHKGPLKCWPNCPSIENGPFFGSHYSHRYYLIELHFHWGCQGHENCTGTKENGMLGSEHLVGNYEAYDMEMHMVHVEDHHISKEGEIDWDGAKGDKHGIAVLAIFFEVQDSKPQDMKPLDKLTALAPGRRKREAEDNTEPPHRGKREAEDNTKPPGRGKREAEDDMEISEQMDSLVEVVKQVTKLRSKRSLPSEGDHAPMRLNPGAFIRKVTSEGWNMGKTSSQSRNGPFSTYCTYHGSLTTPSCEEVVTWVIFMRPLKITCVQVNAFTYTFPKPHRNFRLKLGTTTDLQCLIHQKIGDYNGKVPHGK